MRYTLAVTTDIATVESPDEDDLHHQTDDYCISDEVMRIMVKGNYASVMLQWAGLYINDPYIYGSHWTHQVERSVGIDCADLVGACMQNMGSDIEDDPSAQSLYNDAVAGDHGLSVGTARTTDNGQIPQPEPGDIVLFDTGGPSSIDHATIFREGDGSSADFLDDEDGVIHATGRVNKVISELYSDAALLGKGHDIAVIRYSPE